MSQTKRIVKANGSVDSIAIADLGDDSLVHCFLYLNVKDFLSINKTCIHFNKLTNGTNDRQFLNEYWKNQCTYVCINVKENKSFKVQDWKQFYRILIDFFFKYKYLKPSNHEKFQQHSWRQFGAGVDLFPDNVGYNPILKAINDDNVAIFQLLQCNIKDINKPTRNKMGKDLTHGHTPLGYCCKQGSISIVKYLLNTDENPNVDILAGSGWKKQTPLMCLCVDVADDPRKIEIARLLINDQRMTRQGINLRQRHSGSRPVTWCALHSGKIKSQCEIAKLLLNDKRIDVNADTGLSYGKLDVLTSIRNIDQQVILLYLANDNIDVQEHCLKNMIKNPTLSNIVKDKVRKRLSEI